MKEDLIFPFISAHGYSRLHIHWFMQLPCVKFRLRWWCWNWLPE